MYICVQLIYCLYIYSICFRVSRPHQIYIICPQKHIRKLFHKAMRKAFRKEAIRRNDGRKLLASVEPWRGAGDKNKVATDELNQLK